MGIKSKEININSIMVEKIKLKYYVSVEYVSQWGKANSSIGVTLWMIFLMKL